jgi:hypothetical protein
MSGKKLTMSGKNGIKYDIRPKNSLQSPQMDADSRRWKEKQPRAYYIFDQ